MLARTSTSAPAAPAASACIEEGVAVEALAAQRDEQIAGRNWRLSVDTPVKTAFGPARVAPNARAAVCEIEHRLSAPLQRHSAPLRHR